MGRQGENKERERMKKGREGRKGEMEERERIKKGRE